MSKIQSVLFNKILWTTSKARDWLEKNDLTRIKKVDITKEFLRYRIRQPGMFKKFRSINVKGVKGVRFIIGFL
ncbi:hypothetical protein LCGC14_0704670 [marine sediment metagenome]|uniref:Uncharacterized protein n=1 Tax=marine sediment metagenome TaxID=412755 RepID=A0A0F9QGW8_9ZZZZ|nr:hypothetical protein [archaeon]